jgi:5-methylcytosine-specific restriction endonuclease McrA
MNKPIVLQLNANWLPIGQKTVKEAIISMTSEGSSPPALALDIAYDLGEDGEYDFSTPSYVNPVKWEDWVSLEIREYDFVISSSKFSMRVPTVLIAPNYRNVPMRSPRATKFNVFERDNGVCQYTGKKTSRKEGNVDHIIPLSRGGRNTWQNMVWSDLSINSKKGDRLPHEAGLKLIRKPVEPPVVPVSVTLKEAKHPSWVPFLINKN